MLGLGLPIPIEKDFVPPWVLPGAAIDMNFAASLYYGGNLSDLISVSRASSEYATNSAGQLILFGPNVPCITDLGLQVWEGRTNVVLQSQFAASWTLTNTTLTANAVTSPDGTANAASLADNSTNNIHQAFQSIGGVTAATDNVQTLYAKAVGGRYLTLSFVGTTATSGCYAVYDLVGGTVTQSGALAAGGTLTSATMTQLGATGWYRLTLIGRTTTDTSAYFMVSTANAATYTPDGSGRQSYAGGSNTYSIFGAQREQNAFPSPYIPTTTTSAARAADNITLLGVGAYNSGDMSFVAQTINGGGISSAAQLVDPGAGSNWYFGSTTTVREFNSTELSATLGSGSYSGLVKSGFAFTKGTSRSVVANNGTVATSATSPGTWTGSSYHLGSTGSSQYLNANIQRLSVFNSRLPDATLKALTV